jgi:hypothetical protein
MSAAVLSALLAPGFAPPFAVTAGGEVIDLPADAKTWVAHANGYPWVGDLDGDGKPDLLIGQGGGPRKSENGPTGRLRVYRNTGGAGKPRFGAAGWFDDAVPTGRIPEG